MAKKRVLNSIRLDKIAAVDRPCQEHALAMIVKRDGGKPDATLTIAKKTFQEALNAQLISEKVSDTFWRAFENQWAVREAFRTAMTDEVAEGGDGSVAIEGFVAAMKQIATLAAEHAREAAATTETDLEAAVEASITKWLEEQEKDMNITTKAALKAAIAKFAVATATVAEMQEIQKAAEDLDALDMLPADGPLAVRKADPAVAALTRKVAVMELPADARKHYDGLADDAARDAFMAKSADDRQADVDAINKGDPVLYTAKDGTEVRKSDGAVVLAMAKRMDTLAGENAELKKSAGDAQIEKAASEFPNVPYAATLLKAAASLPESERAEVVKGLRASNESASIYFKVRGNPGGGDVSADSTQGRMDAIVKRYQTEGKMSESDALLKAAGDAEYQALYAQSLGESPAHNA